MVSVSTRRSASQRSPLRSSPTTPPRASCLPVLPTIVTAPPNPYQASLPIASFPSRPRPRVHRRPRSLPANAGCSNHRCHCMRCVGRLERARLMSTQLLGIFPPPFGKSHRMLFGWATCSPNFARSDKEYGYLPGTLLCQAPAPTFHPALPSYPIACTGTICTDCCEWATSRPSSSRSISSIHDSS